jgi:hypothetical protein
MRRRFALDAPRLVDDAFEQAPHGRDLQRSGRGLLDVLENLLLAVGRVDREAEDAFELADLDGVFGALVEQAHEDFVDAIDGVAEADQISFSIVSVDHKKPLRRGREEVSIVDAVERPFAVGRCTRPLAQWK